MTGARQDVVCKIYGENLDSLAHLALKLGNIVSTVEGTENLYVEPINGLLKSSFSMTEAKLPIMELISQMLIVLW